MNKSIIRYLVSRVVQFEGLFLLLPVAVSAFYREKIGFVYFAIALVTFMLGTVASLVKPKDTAFFAREGFVSVSLSWILLSLIGALPFVCTGEIPNYLDALFETVSGFTTTGASILTDVEAMSKTSMFWRCFTNWIGGMGVLVFIMSVVPLSGSYNMHLMRAESTGHDVGKLVPKVKDTAKILYGIYIGMTVTLIIIYKVCGIGFYKACILAFSTMGTGGFADLNLSLGGYPINVQIVAAIFMFLCGVNFNAYFLLLNRKFKDFFKMEDVRTYAFIVLVASVAIAINISGSAIPDNKSLHNSFFQVISIMTTTGFSTTDFNLWPMFSKTILLIVLLIGGCAGSTSGGFKVSRVIILFRTIGKELGHLTHPRSIRKVMYNDNALVEEKVKSVLSFSIAYVIITVFSTLLVSLDNMDLTTTFTSVLTSLSNVGPGLGSVIGPAGNFSSLGFLSKGVLIFDMLAGRLELFPMLVLFYPGTWKKN